MPVTVFYVVGFKKGGWSLNRSETIPKIRVTPKLKADLEGLATADGRTLSDYVRRVLEQHVQSAGCFDELASQTLLLKQPRRVAK